MAQKNTHSNEADTSEETNRTLLSVARMLLPIAENYGRSREAAAVCEAADNPKSNGKPRPIRPGSEATLSDDERKAFGMAFARMLAEGAEVAARGSAAAASRIGYDATGNYPAPTLVQMASALSRLRSGTKSMPVMMSEHHAETNGEPLHRVAAQPIVAAPATRVAAPVAPVPVAMIRRQHVATRHVNEPPVPMNSGCGCSSCAPQGPVATRNPDGSCEPNPFEISCETQVRLKQCLVAVICEFLRCLERQLCVNGKMDFNNLAPAVMDCLGEALCTLLRCVPDALCPTTPEPSQSCHNDANHGLPCNFAVAGAKQ